MRALDQDRNQSASNVIAEKQSDDEKPSQEHAPTHGDIQLRAYWIHLDRGGEHGYDLDDWIQAERELIERLTQAS
jgi:hypothetical protein